MIMSAGGNDRIDPVEAFFSGISSSGMRLLIALSAVGLACVAAHAANTSDGVVFPFELMLMIFAWASEGFWFVLGLACLLGGLFLIYRFGLDEGGKLEWFIIFGVFTIYLLPMNFTREEWPDLPSFLNMLEPMGEPVIKRDWIAHIVIVTGFAAIFWLLPPALAIVVEKLRRAKETGE